MAKKSGIRIRISHQRAEALLEICEEMLEEFIPSNEHRQLLREYLRELKYRLQNMLERRQELYTLLLNSAESVAFCQVWNMMDISSDKYASLIVDNLLRKISVLAA